MCNNVFVGCDISKATIDVCIHQESKNARHKQFSNTVAGHTQLINWITQESAIVRVVIEATGNYSIDLALVLDGCSSIELMVANPSATRQFARAQMRRSKTDPSVPDVVGHCQLLFTSFFLCCNILLSGAESGFFDGESH